MRSDRAVAYQRGTSCQSTYSIPYFATESRAKTTEAVRKIPLRMGYRVMAFCVEPLPLRFAQGQGDEGGRHSPHSSFPPLLVILSVAKNL